MTAKSREEKPKMQQSAKTTKTKRDLDPAGFMRLVPPGFTEADIEDGHVALVFWFFGVGNRSASAVGNSQIADSAVNNFHVAGWLMDRKSRQSQPSLPFTKPIFEIIRITLTRFNV